MEGGRDGVKRTRGLLLVGYYFICYKQSVQYSTVQGTLALNEHKNQDILYVIYNI